MRQDIAVTGSINQRGKIQPIGGVNQKVEGMFDVCRSAGELTGTQGVVIPHQNAKNLMLRDDVVEAIREGKFNVYAVKTIDEGLELLTGTPAGEVDSNGEYPEGTVNHLITKRLGELNDSMRGPLPGVVRQWRLAPIQERQKIRIPQKHRGQSPFYGRQPRCFFWLVVFIAPNLAK